MSKKTDKKKKNVLVEENKVEKFLTKVFGDPQKKILKDLQKKVDEINALEDKIKKLSDEEIRAKFEKLTKQVRSEKKTLDEVLVEVFAIVREVSVRTLGMRHFDVQLIGGMVLHQGKVAEMKTGEGKTLVATLPVVLNSMEGRGVHVVTVNDYLAQRDASEMGAIYDFLGLSVGAIINEASFIFDKNFDNEAHENEDMRKLRPATRKDAYAADITYGTNNEFGFDYLRDNMVNETDLLRQRELNFAIVDEVDSILIDEARTPLIISAPAADNPDAYIQFAKIAAQLVPEDYDLDEKRRSVALTDEGIDKVEKLLGMKNLYTPEHTRAVYHIEQALRAETLFKRDRDYVVSNDGEVIIVDEHTGRLMNGRRYNEGLHQAIEAKEKVPVLNESQTLATISFQNFFRLYNKLSGMTGTAFTEAEEFQQIYALDVVQIPPNKPVIRDDKEDLIFKTEKAKLKAVAEEIKKHHKAGRPVLVGSATIEKNEQIAKYLDKEGIKYNLLNAKNNEHEASIVAKAGEKGAITLATNIAGRGTDIKLGKGVKELGGLVVLGSERHESRRIDNQFRGRGGRQGDPGETQFFVSTEDDLMRIFQGEKIAVLMDRLGVPEDQPIQHKSVSKMLENSQKMVEGFNFDTRKNVVQYDNVINRHRKVVYTMRRKILEGEDITPQIKQLLNEKVQELVELPSKNNPDFVKNFIQTFPVEEDTAEALGSIKNDKKRLEIANQIVEDIYLDKRAEIGEEDLQKVEREVYLQVLDTLWMNHLENMGHLREGIHWRSVGQRDPLVEYREESQKLFEGLQNTLRDEVIRVILNVRKTDVLVRSEEGHETELTRLAETAVEKGVNEIQKGDSFHDDDFSTSNVKKSDSKNAKNAKKNSAKKAKKAQRQNKKKGRR
ncbi:MAG: preprotein translocase subunit SecA [bacterium]|nr:preprotein translocase subunit SecA [bacterium]